MTVVGSRNHTTYGKDVCVRLIEALAPYPVVIVSGLATGIDSIAHETALRVGLPTIAFPGSGLAPEAIYPRSNIDLAERIVAHGGCLLSEFEKTEYGKHWMFPRRNRLMAGIAQATLMIEAAEQSGTLITARLTSEYNRDLLVVPGPITSPLSYGPNFFLKLGATPITSPTDLIEALGFEVPKQTSNQTNHTPCTPEEQRILDVLIEPLTRDELAYKLSQSIITLNTQLTLMELKGLIKEAYGKLRRA